MSAGSCATTCCRRERRRAQVDRQEGPRGAVRSGQRGAHRLALERGPEAEPVRLREPPGRRQPGLAVEARQRLVADRLAAGQRHDRLEHRPDRLGPGDHGREVLALLLGHDEDVLGVVAARAPAAALLGPGERPAGELEQRAGALRVVRIAGDARRAAQPAAHRRRQLDGGAGRLREREGARAVGVRQHEAELVAPDARHRAEVAHRRGEAARRPAEQLVPVGMAARVVDALELVDVEQHHRHRPTVAACLVDLARERLLEAAVVGEVGQRVAVHQLLEAALARLEAGGHRVELVGELAQLVAAAPAQPRAQVAAADSAGRRAQPVERVEQPTVEAHDQDGENGHDQHPQRDQDALVALVQRSLRWTHVVAEGQLAAVAETLDQHLVAVGAPADASRHARLARAGRPTRGRGGCARTRAGRPRRADRPRSPLQRP